MRKKKIKTSLYLAVLFLWTFPCLANEQEALNQFKERLTQTTPNQTAILKEFGEPQEIFEESSTLKENLKKGLALTNSNNQPLLLDANFKKTVSEIDSVWTYDYFGFGKWASFVGIYFDKDKNVLGWDWRVPKTTVFPYDKNVFFTTSPSETDGEKIETILAWPFTFLRGIKQIGCEISKAPIVFLEVSAYLGPKAGWQAAIQKTETSKSLFNYFFKNKSKQNPGTEIKNLFCEFPLVGSWFDHTSATTSVKKVDALFLLGGIHQVNDHAQRMDPLETYLKEALNTGAVYQIPWNYGTMWDVGYSTLNLSYGDSLVLAQKIVQRGNLKPGDHIALFAHSGAVQQIIGIARILRDHNIYVTQAFGVAGVFVGGKAPIEKFEIVYNPDLDRFKWLLGFQFLTPGAEWVEVRGTEPSKGHEISGSIDKRNRLLYDGYFKEISTFFKSD